MCPVITSKLRTTKTLFSSARMQVIRVIIIYFIHEIAEHSGRPIVRVNDLSQSSRLPFSRLPALMQTIIDRFRCRIFVNRSLHLENIKFYGFDMDYTLAGTRSFYGIICPCIIITHVYMQWRRNIKCVSWVGGGRQYLNNLTTILCL